MSTVIAEKAAALNDWLIETRRHFHQHPEASLEEFWTTDEICKYLDKFGIPYERFKNSTGVLAKITGAHPGKTVALRSDIDALSVVEKTGCAYASQNPGFMHACGHDAHIAINLGAARILNDLKDQLHGTVYHVFQPAEEVAKGANSVIAEGKWYDQVDNFFGGHVWSNGPIGTISVNPGPVMASTDRFTIEIEGVSGHGAQPEQTIDATLVAAEMVVAFQPLVSREVSPLDSLVVTVGKLVSGTRFNVISGSATLEGTVRYFTQELTEKIEDMVQRIVTHTAAMYRAKATMKYEHLTLPLINEATSAKRARDAIVKLYGESVIREYPKTTGGEDFSSYLQKKPGAFAHFGCANETVHAPHHSDHFNIDERVLQTGAAVYAQYAVDFLSE
jgi:amidohydrolase